MLLLENACIFNVLLVIPWKMLYFVVFSWIFIENTLNFVGFARFLLFLSIFLAKSLESSEIAWFSCGFIENTVIFVGVAAFLLFLLICVCPNPWNPVKLHGFHEVSLKIPWIYMLCLWFSMDSNGTPSYWHWWFESMDCRSAATLNRSSASRFWCLWKSLGRVSMHAAHPCAHQPPRTMNFEFPAAIYSKILMKTMKSAEIRWPHSMPWAIQTEHVSLGDPQGTEITPKPLVGQLFLKKYS